MKIFDCTTYYNEDLILEVRFNILNKHVDKFVIAEAKYSHSGERKKLNFNISKFPELMFINTLLIHIYFYKLFIYQLRTSRKTLFIKIKMILF